MLIFHGLESADASLTGSVLTIGNFDGVHLAHQQIVAQARHLAEEVGTKVVALTFEPHPFTVVAPAKVPPRLTPMHEKLHLLSEVGVDATVVARSEPALMKLEAEQFVEEVVQRRFRPRHIVEGPSFGFGRGRRGTSELLKHLVAGFGCEVHIIEQVRISVDGDELFVSSSLIRRLLAEGDVCRAAMCLGRRYALTGSVIHGDHRGRQIGFPTANLAVSDQLVPGEGVYTGRAIVGSQPYLCAISIGRTPTFGGAECRVEGHLLDFAGDLYGQSLRLEFERRLRDQVAFESGDALRRQLDRDVAEVRSRPMTAEAGNMVAGRSSP